MSEQILKFDENVVNKKDFHASKQAIDSGRKNMSFLIEDESVYLKYNKIWNKIKKLLNIKFHSQPIHDSKYIKSKVKTFDEAINTSFSDNEIPKEKSNYICIAAICIGSVLKKEGKNHP